MDEAVKHDVAIIGGGLAGLSLSILLGKAGYKVLVLEKEEYPKHKVCGEYISNESRAFLNGLGLNINSLQLPGINKLLVTDVHGYQLTSSLPQGGFGISRYKLDAMLAEFAKTNNVTLLTKTRAEQIQYADDGFTIKTNIATFYAKVACGCWGKRSNMDIKLQRQFITSEKRKLNNYVGIKYHIKYDWPEDLIALHNFQDGYCGISRIEDDKCCLCYLTTANNLQKNGSDIKQMEQNVLMKNPELKKIFSNAEFLYAQPLAISQISFQKKEQVLDHVLLLGDAAGSITPLCGNGMSMALHAAKIAFENIVPFLQHTVSRDEMEQAYTSDWLKQFGTRLKAGRILQANFGKNMLTTLFLKLMNYFSFFKLPIIKNTAGKPF
jgi:flavin-dependent dehydrogenase